MTIWCKIPIVRQTSWCTEEAPRPQDVSLVERVVYGVYRSIIEGRVQPTDDRSQRLLRLMERGVPLKEDDPTYRPDDFVLPD